MYKKPGIFVINKEMVEEELDLLQTQYDTPDPETTATLSADADDWIVYNRTDEVYALGSDVFPTAGIVVGDNDDDDYIRGLFSFDIGDVSGTVSTAMLRILQGTTDGTPYADLGALTVDHVNFGDIEANAGDFSGNTLTANIASTTDSSNEVWKEFSVRNYVQADIEAGRSTSQFRIRFASDTDSNGDDDLAYMESSEDAFGTGNTPQLVVTYQ